MNAVDGHKVVVVLTKKINNAGRYEGKVVNIIGHKNDPGVDILLSMIILIKSFQMM